MQRVAEELLTSFGAVTVAVNLHTWGSPMMLVTDDQIAGQIDRDAVRTLLNSATDAPVASSVPLRVEGGQDSTRCLRVLFQDQPSYSAALVVYAPNADLSPAEQIAALKQLNEFAIAVRGELSQRSPAPETSLLPTVQAPVSASTVGARQSLTQFHRDLDLDATCARIANESRRLLQCDRVTVLTPHRGSSLKVQSISGVSVIDRRSNSVRAIENLVTTASVMAQPLILPSETPLPPQIQTPLDDYLDETGVMATVLLPLYAQKTATEDIDEPFDPFDGDGEFVGVIALEYFEGEPPQTLSPSLSIVATEATFALKNAEEHHSIFGVGLWKAVGRVTDRRRLPYATLGLLSVIGLLAATMFIEVDHHVIATGTAEPTDQRRVFSRVDGICKTIFVTDGQTVSAGDPLMQLENAELESRAETLSGEIATATRRLSSIETLRLGEQEDLAKRDRLAMEESQLRLELNSLHEQQAVIHKQQKELLITSPIDGTVVAWQIEQRLGDRPVSRGNMLLRVVDHTGPWSLKLQIPDYQSGAVINEFQGSSELPVKFAVATDPDGSFQAKLKSIATAARLDETGQHIIDASATVDFPIDAFGLAYSQTKIEDETTGDSSEASVSAKPFGVRAGADVTARIECGKRSALRSWFSDVFDFVNRNIVFYFR